MDRLFMLFAELQQLLEEERSALLSGSAERILAAADRKRSLADLIEAAAAEAEAPPIDTETLARIARYNRDNSVICTAMLRHMTQALDRLRRSDAHRSYRPDGSEREVATRHTLGAA